MSEDSNSSADVEIDKDFAIRRITIVGAGYVGGPTGAVCAARNPNVHVTVVDVNKERIDAWNSRHLPIYEPGLKDVVESCRGRNLFFSTDVPRAIRDAECVYIAVNTGTKSYGVGADQSYDLTAWEMVARDIAKYACEPRLYVIVEKSTVPVATAERVEEVMRSCAANPRTRFAVVSNPEFLAEGTAIRDLERPDRVLIGARGDRDGQTAAQALSRVYAAWVPAARIVHTNQFSSELVKLAANCFLAQRLSSVNALSAICESSGASITEVTRVIGMDSRLGDKFLKTSLGWGGSCFKKDVLALVYLCEMYRLNEVAEYFRHVNDMNEYQKSRFCRRILRNMFDTLRGKKCVIFGFAFKKDTGDTRESPAIHVANFLFEEHADVHVYDPKVDHSEIALMFPRVRCASDPMAAAELAHCIIVCTEWDEFLSYDYASIYESMNKPAFIFDGRNILDHERLRAIGFRVYAVGSRAPGETELPY